MAVDHKYISEYFFTARDIVDKFNKDNLVVMQFFQRQDNAILAGIAESLELLKDNLEGKEISIRYLPDGSFIQSHEVVLEIEGRYQDFGIYEGLIDGILSRATSIATNSYECLQASRGKEIVCMSDRSDHYCNQERDGRAMSVAGITAFSSHAQASSKDHKVYTSIPHALIQNFEGDLVKAMEAYKKTFPNEDLIALVDFHNDVIKDSLFVLKALGNELKGVRVDTSKAMRDFMFEESEDEYGVTPNQIKRLREALDQNGGSHVKIYVSSGFTPEKIKAFEDAKTPVDAYGVGEYLLKLRHSFCADCVKINGKELAKIGRQYRSNPKLIEFKWE